MALVSLRQLLDYAAEHQFGVPAFNVNNLEQTRAIMEAADQTDSPVIMQASAGARKYAGAPFLRAMMEAAMNEFPHIPVVVHQDQGRGVQFQRPFCHLSWVDRNVIHSPLGLLFIRDQHILAV